MGDEVEMRELVVKMNEPGPAGFDRITLDGKPLVSDSIDVRYGLDGAEFTIGCKVAQVQTRAFGSVRWRLIFAGDKGEVGNHMGKREVFVKGFILEDGTEVLL